MMDQAFWFPAKQFGWGWGLPSSWQGWAVVGVFAVLLVAGYFIIGRQARPVLFSVYSVGLCLSLVAVCYATGEPPSWRWGS